MTTEYRVPKIITKIKCFGIKGKVFTKIKSESKHIYGKVWLSIYSIPKLISFSILNNLILKIAVQ